MLHAQGRRPRQAGLPGRRLLTRVRRGAAIRPAPVGRSPFDSGLMGRRPPRLQRDVERRRGRDVRLQTVGSVSRAGRRRAVGAKACGHREADDADVLRSATHRGPKPRPVPSEGPSHFELGIRDPVDRAAETGAFGLQTRRQVVPLQPLVEDVEVTRARESVERRSESVEPPVANRPGAESGVDARRGTSRHGDVTALVEHQRGHRERQRVGASREILETKRPLDGGRHRSRQDEGRPAHRDRDVWQPVAARSDDTARDRAARSPLRGRRRRVGVALGGPVQRNSERGGREE